MNRLALAGIAMIRSNDSGSSIIKDHHVLAFTVAILTGIEHWTWTAADCLAWYVAAQTSESKEQITQIQYGRCIRRCCDLIPSLSKISWPIKVHSEFWHASYPSVGSNSLRATRYFLNIESSTTIIEHITSTNWIHQRPFIPEAFVGYSMAECSALRSHEKPLKHQMKHPWTLYGNGLNSLFQACQPSSWTGAGRLWVGNWGSYGEMAVFESAIFSLWKTSWTYIAWRWLEDFSHSNTVSVRRFYTFMWLILVCIHNTIRFQLLQRLRTRALVFISQQDEKIQFEVSGNDRLVDWGTLCVLIPKFMFLWVSCQFDVKTVKRLTVETWKFHLDWAKICIEEPPISCSFFPGLFLRPALEGVVISDSWCMRSLLNSFDNI